MGYSQYFTKAVLDWGFCGATPTRPVNYGLGLSLGSPTSVSGSEIAVGSSNITRQTLGVSPGAWAAASTPASSAFVTNNSAATFSNLSAGSFSGCQIWDTGSSTNGSMLVNGLLATARTTLAGDSLVCAAGALTVSLA